jgi:transcriptional regulator with XRE-family HTH domain
MDIKQKFGLIIRELRLEKGISQERMALDANIDRTYVGHIESGSRNVSIEIVEKLASFFQMPMSELFKLVEEKK